MNFLGGWGRIISQSGCAGILIAGLAGCATQTMALRDSASHLPQQAELISTPYFAQEMHQCGPASLAMGLQAAGFQATPEELEAQVYVPSREGSLQPEMLSAARRHGAFSALIPPRLNSLLTEVAYGHPVVVLLNLGLSWVPRWHYAVVIGYDRPGEKIILRSGPNARELMRMSTFEHTWARSGYWGMVILPPGELPVQIEAEDAGRVLASMEKYTDTGKMLNAYQIALKRWPDELLLRIGLGNTAYRSNDLSMAEQAYRAADKQHPGNAVVLNNLASILQLQGRFSEALPVAEQAASIHGPWQSQAITTRDEIRAAMGL